MVLLFKTERIIYQHTLLFQRVTSGKTPKIQVLTGFCLEIGLDLAGLFDCLGGRGKIIGQHVGAMRLLRGQESGEKPFGDQAYNQTAHETPHRSDYDVLRFFAMSAC